MSYIHDNKAAWEEAFENRKADWGENNCLRLRDEELPFLHPDIVRKVREMDFSEKDVAQFCCNNGRELLSLMKLGARCGTGFDIAENIIEQARQTAEKAGIDCGFVSCDILQMDPKYHGNFDFIFFTIGAITWFKDLNALFEIVSKCLKPGGVLLLHDFHPLMNMLPLLGEADFNAKNPNKLAYSYFRSEPWIENKGMEYMTVDYESKTFTSFSHTMSAIVNAVIGSDLNITGLEEFDHDVGLTEVYDDKGFPLSLLLTAAKADK